MIKHDADGFVNTKRCGHVNHHHHHDTIQDRNVDTTQQWSTGKTFVRDVQVQTQGSAQDHMAQSLSQVWPVSSTLLNSNCAGIPDGTVPSCWLSRRSTMSLVGFSWWPRCSEVSASNIRPSGLRCLRPTNLELSSAQDQTITWQFIAFQTETESASISAVLSASVDPYLMKGLVSFLYYDYYYYY